MFNYNYMEEKLKDYRFSINTEVRFRGEWQFIDEVWFEEKKIGLRGTGHLINYSEVEDIRN